MEGKIKKRSLLKASKSSRRLGVVVTSVVMFYTLFLVFISSFVIFIINKSKGARI